MQRNIILGALALTAIFAFSTPASAQRGRGGYGGGLGYSGGGYGGYRGGYNGYRGGYGGYSGYRGGYSGYNGYRGGYGGYGYGSGLGYGIALGSTLGGYGYGGYGYAPSYSGYSGYNYAPSYSGYSAYNYAPSYSGYSAYNYAPSVGYLNQGVVPSAGYIDQGTSRLALAPATSSRDSLYYAPEATNNTAHLRVLVPADAKVWVGGMQTEKQGSERDFNSPALTPGKTYTYEVKARWMQAGEPVERTRKVKVLANQTTTVDFGPVAEVDK